MVAQGRVAKAHWRALKGSVSAPVTDSARHSQTPPDAGREADAELYAKLLGETARVSWAEIERLFAEHDAMMADYQPVGVGKITRLAPRLS